MSLRFLSTGVPTAACIVLAAVTPGAAVAGHGFLTPQPAFITLAPGLPAGSFVLPIISSGESIGDFTFQGIPDGIGLAPGPDHTVEVFINHEETTVPFFGSADFQDATVSQLRLDLRTGAVVNAKVAIPASAGFLRFCSASMAGPAEGFSRYTFFTGEETDDIVDVPPGAPYGSDPATAPQRQAGYAVVLDALSGAFTHVPGMGRLNHENTIAVPGGWPQIALVTTDDTFNGPSAQLYMYLAARESHIWQDRGSLWAFRVTRTNEGPVNPNNPFNGANDYLDLESGDDWQGRFIRVPRNIAEGNTDVPPQQALEDWSNEHNVFQFIRLEDLAYDVHNPRVIYIADTGRSRVVPDPETGRLTRGPSGTVGFADNGRIFKMVFNARDPRRVDSFSILADGDQAGIPEFVPMRAPDNIDTSANSLMVQEDADDALIWRLDFATGNWGVVASVNDPDGESSGIVDASSWFGPGSWILDVQGHGVNVIEEQQGDVLRKLESGQLMLMKIPGT